MKIGIIIFARMDSERLKNKIFTKINGKYLFQLVLNRLKMIEPQLITIVATSDRPIDDKIECFSNKYNLNIFRGSINDVIDRAIKCCEMYGLDGFVRICADRPLLPFELINLGLKSFLSNKFDLVTNSLNKTYPKGCMTEIVKTSALKNAYSSKLNKDQKEHITKYIYDNDDRFVIKELPYGKLNWVNLNLSVDTLEDKKRIEWIIKTSKKPSELLSLNESIKLAEKWNYI